MSKYIKPNGSYYTEFCTQRFDTGAATNADSLPVATIMKNGVDDGTSPTAWSTGITVTGIDAGRYRITGVVPSTYIPGDIIDISVQAVVNSVTGKCVVDEFTVVSANVYDSLVGTGDYLDVNSYQITNSGANLSGIPWNSNWDAEVQSEVQDALEVNNLDHLIKVAKDTNWATTVTKESIIDLMTSKDSNQTYDRATDSSEATKDSISVVMAGVAATIQANTGDVTVGTLIGGDYDSTYLSNGTYWTTAPTTPAVDGYGLNAYLQFDADTNQYINSIVIRGYFNAGPGRYTNIGAYNYVTSGVDILSDSTSRMNNASANSSYTYSLLSSHQKADGEVKIYFLSPSVTTADRLYIDQCLINVNTAGATSADIAEAVKQKLITVYYEGGIWYDDINGTSGDVLGTNGTLINPTNNTGDAYTLSANLGTKRIYLKPGSNFTLAGDNSNWRFIGAGRLDLNGQTITDAVFENLYTISGTGAGDDMEFSDCGIGDMKADHSYFHNCKLKGTLELEEGDDYFLLNCSDTTPSAGNECNIIFASGATAVLRDWRGGIHISNMASGNSCVVDGAGRIIIDGSGGSLTVRGHFPEVTNAANFIASGGTITDTARYAEDQNVYDVTSTVDSNVLQWSGQNVASGAIPVYEAGASGGLPIVDANGYVDADIVSVEGDETPIDGKSLAAALRYIAAICAGKISGAQTGQETFNGLDGTTTRVVVDVDESGNRTGITYDP